MNKENDIKKVKELQHGENCVIFWAEEGGGEVYRIWDTLFLFEIPQYGGEGNFVNSYHINQLEELVNEAYSWT